MTRYDDDREIRGEVQDEGVDREILQDKMVAEDVLRGDTRANRSNPNDPNSLTGGDLEGEEHGGEGKARSGGVDGGPARTTPLPGDRQ